MNLPNFLAALRERDIQVWADAGRLRCNAPTGALTPELRDELRGRKTEILEFLHAAESLARQQLGIVPLQSAGTAAPIFAVAGHNGDVFCFRALAQQVGDSQPFFGLQPPGLSGSRQPLARVEDLAAYFAAQIRAFRPNGPYVIAGYCAGGAIAFELARQLLQDGAEIRKVALFGSSFPTAYRFLPRLRERVQSWIDGAIRHNRALAAVPAKELPGYITRRFRDFMRERTARRDAAKDPVFTWRDKVGRATLTAIRRYEPGPFHGRLSLFWPCKNCEKDAAAQWSAVARDTEEYFGPDGCNGAAMLRDPHAATFAKLFKGSLQGGRDRKAAVSEGTPTASRGWKAGHMEAMSF